MSSMTNFIKIIIYLYTIIFMNIIINCDLIQNSFHNDDPYYNNNHNHHLTNWSIIRRNRRGLIFNGGGTAKFVGGAIYPLYLVDKVHWRQVNCLYNFQTQYTAPATPTYWWDKWHENGRSSFTSTSSSSFLSSILSLNSNYENMNTNKLMPDDSRKFVYLALENFMNAKGVNGKKCLLRAICENGQINEHIGIFSEFFDTILTPGKEDLNEDYKNAHKAGKFGADCLSLFPECPKGSSFLDSLIVLI